MLCWTFLQNRDCPKGAMGPRNLSMSISRGPFSFVATFRFLKNGHHILNIISMLVNWPPWTTYFALSLSRGHCCFPAGVPSSGKMPARFTTRPPSGDFTGSSATFGNDLPALLGKGILLIILAYIPVIRDGFFRMIVPVVASLPPQAAETVPSDITGSDRVLPEVFAAAAAVHDFTQLAMACQARVQDGRQGAQLVSEYNQLTLFHG